MCDEKWSQMVGKLCLHGFISSADLQHISWDDPQRTVKRIYNAAMSCCIHITSQNPCFAWRKDNFFGETILDIVIVIRGFPIISRRLPLAPGTRVTRPGFGHAHSSSYSYMIYNTLHALKLNDISQNGPPIIILITGKPIRFILDNH